MQHVIIFLINSILKMTTKNKGMRRPEKATHTHAHLCVCARAHTHTHTHAHTHKCCKHNTYQSVFTVPLLDRKEMILFL